MELKTFNREDVPELLSWIQSEEELYQWSGTLFSWPMEQGTFYIHLEQEDSKPQMLYPLGFYKGHKLAGYCELCIYYPDNPSARLSCLVIRPEWRQRGLGQMMLEKVLRFGFNELHLNRISLGVFARNVAAIGLYRKLGFFAEGTLREQLKVGSTFWDCHVMGILRKEWQRMTPGENIKVSHTVPRGYSESVMLSAKA